MKKTLVILLTAILAFSLFISCEGDLDEVLEAKITVTFDGNGSTDGEMDALEVKKGEDFKLTKNAFEKTDYIFTGWNTAADGSGTSYDNEGTAKFDKDTTLYAQWIKELTITFNANGGTPATKTQKVGKGIATALDANTFTRTSYYFKGWSSSTLGDVEYADGATVTLESNLVLYAIWSVDPVVTLTKGTGISEVTGAGSYAPGATVRIDATMSDGYKWSKWTQTTGGADVSTTKEYSFTMGTENINYTANATPISYTVAFDKNEATGTEVMADQNFTYDVAQNLTANAFTWEGHSFTGWNTTSSGSGDSYANGASVNNLTTTDGATVTLYAQWSEGPNLIKSTTEAITLSSGDWTIEDATVNVTGRITIDGSVNLLLPDGMTLNANSGITVSSGNTLVIDKFDSDSTGTGILTATGTGYDAGIGGINQIGKADGGTVTINGGNVTATGGYSGAGIGGGNGGNGGTISINGGTVTATGGGDAAGIGGGYEGAGGEVTINGGNVTATGGENSSALVTKGMGIGAGGLQYSQPDHGNLNVSTVTLKFSTNSGSSYTAYSDSDYSTRYQYMKAE